MSLFQSEYEVKVPFEDLDPMNVVWHGNYMRYMEQARCDMLSKLKYNYNNMRHDGYFYPIAKMDVKYIKSATFEDILVIKTELISIEPAINIKYSISNKQTGEKIFEGSTMQIGIDMNTKESLYVPPQGLVDAVKGVSNEKI
ncbi:acyl-CoA thioesterase [bacterium]|nr:acyl-CoA thioesterase [bacterium]